MQAAPTAFPSELSELSKAFLLEEQKQRRVEIENLIGRMESDQRYGIVITGLVWSWLATNTHKLLPPFTFIAAALPATMMCFFFWRWVHLHKTVHEIAVYTMKLESLFDVPKRGVGWETYLHDPNSPSRPRATLQRVTQVWWRMLLGTNVFIGILFFCLAPTQKQQRTPAALNSAPTAVSPRAIPPPQATPELDQP